MKPKNRKIIAERKAAMELVRKDLDARLESAWKDRNALIDKYITHKDVKTGTESIKYSRSL